MEPAEIIADREKIYGDFSDVSRIAQSFKNIIHGENATRALRRNDRPLSLRQIEALDFIATKMARILSGNPDYPDNWDDIAGYAKLCSASPVANMPIVITAEMPDRRMRQRRIYPDDEFLARRNGMRRHSLCDRRKS